MKQLIYAFALLLPALIFGQDVTVKGAVLEKTNQNPIELASIAFLDSETNAVIQETTSDTKGHFEVKIKPGKYHLHINFFDFEPAILNQVQISEDKNIGKVFLTAKETKVLDEVKVVSEKSSIETRLDKKIFNVGKDLISKGGSANDILNNVPSVSVNATGTVSLRGNSSVRILINGKPSVMTQNNGLEQIPAESIERVEVITNPSAQYDAQGASGIINIILKKNKANGFGSSVTGTAGVPNNNSLGVNMNYKKEKFNLFSDIRYGRLTLFGDDKLFRTNYENTAVSGYIDQKTDRIRNLNRFNLYFGSDYYINQNNTLTASYYYRHNTAKSNVDYLFSYLDANKNQTQRITAKESYREPQISNQIELNYVKNFAKKGKKLTANIQYDFWNDDENEFITERTETPSPTVKTIKSRDVESSKDVVFQTDMSFPLTEKSKFDIGLKGEIRRINSDYIVWDNAVQIDSLTNLLHYDERIFGIYSQYSNGYKKFQYQLGLRAEHFNTGSSDLKDEFKTDKNYTKLFPTVHLTYEIKNNFNVQLSYSRRIDRPSFYQLNPFGGIADRRNIRIGNPDLNPMYIDSYEMGTLYKWEKFSLNPSVYHQHTINLFDITVTRNSNDYLVEKSINSGTENRYGFEMNATYTPYKWWFLSSDFNFYKFDQKGLFTVSDKTWSSRLNSRIKLKSWTVQNNFNIIGAKKTGQIESQEQLWADMAVGKEFWKEKASLTFKIDNIFDSRISRDYISGKNYTIDGERRFTGTRASLTFTYKFNRKKGDRDRLPE
ncbi:TonB-dependent receptor domain-containing protein [Flavobacterium sp. H122]|uniref:TonB-dependent receptor domain-containing protein n=1 Tax=Flavobacterium sp. H122 TaxID=2529860 RepID=UPI0010AAF3EC|nr:TonB-dependent receptor [Flavobacterium sp. H122]